MTAQPDLPTVEPEPVQVVPKKNSRLAQLHERYAEAKAAADGAEKALSAIKDAIKLELTQTDPEQRRFQLLPAPGVEARPLNLTYTESWRLNSTQLKKDQPETWVRYAKKSGSWRLSEGGE